MPMMRILQRGNSSPYAGAASFRVGEICFQLSSIHRHLDGQAISEFGHIEFTMLPI